MTGKQTTAVEERVAAVLRGHPTASRHKDGWWACDGCGFGLGICSLVEHQAAMIAQAIPDRPTQTERADSVMWDYSSYIREAVERAALNVADAEESTYRDGLIALGWTPPGGPDRPVGPAPVRITSREALWSLPNGVLWRAADSDVVWEAGEGRGFLVNTETWERYDDMEETDWLGGTVFYPHARPVLSTVIHMGDPDAHAEAFNEGWNEAHRQGVGGSELREWVIGKINSLIAEKPIDDKELAEVIADAVLSEADLSPVGPDPEVARVLALLPERLDVIAETIAGINMDTPEDQALLVKHVAWLREHAEVFRANAVALGLAARPSGVSAEQVERATVALMGTHTDWDWRADCEATVATVIAALGLPVGVSAEQVERAYREAWDDLRKRPDSKIAWGRMDALAAVLGAFTSGTITLNPGEDDDSERCPLCAGQNGDHCLVHTRFPEGGGGTNTPCPMTPTARPVAVSAEQVEAVAQIVADAACDYECRCGADCNELTHTNWEAYLDSARAVLAALGVPTDERNET